MSSREPVWFRTVYSVTGMRFAHEELPPFSLTVRHNGECSIVLSRWEEGSPHAQRADSLRCVATLELKPNPKLRAMFEKLSEGRLPIDSKHPPELPYKYLSDIIVDEEGSISDRRIIPIFLLPPPFVELLRTAGRIIGLSVRHFIALLRWRQDAASPLNPLGHVDFEWSLDRIAWKKAPSDHRVVARVPPPVWSSEQAKNDLEELLRSGEAEPLAHELLREAYDLRRADRSCLMMAVAALETGVNPTSFILLKMPSGW